MPGKESKENCWEVMDCGREPRGHRAGELGECPAALEKRLDGVHGGVNGGRACWMVAGTFCDDRVQGTYVEKVGNCFQCDFFKRVGREERENLQLPVELRERLKGSRPGERSKLNCWEFKKCGRQPGGRNAHDRGTCPAAVERKLDGVHGGTNAGRACWVVPATLCDGEVQGRFAEKQKACEKCEFYNHVYNEEWPRFKLAMILLSRLRET